MFKEAVALASQFTPPVVLSRRSLTGDCSSGIGAFIVINQDGWILTAAHIIEQWSRMVEEVRGSREVESQRRAIEANQAIDHKEKKRQIRRLPDLGKNRTDRCSAWWAFPDASLVEARVLGSVDLAVGRLEPFDPTCVRSYPVFKDPQKDFMPGTSLCKLGYPFHDFRPVYHEDSNRFELPPGAVPLPQFPLDGILTRFISPVEAEKAEYPVLLIETSSPGLRGQSGGPIFDVHGAIWGLQVRTAHYALGFDPPVPGRKPNEREHQFLNVGLGVHAATIIGFLKSLGVKYNLW